MDFHVLDDNQRDNVTGERVSPTEAHRSTLTHTKLNRTVLVAIENDILKNILYQ